MKSTTVRTRHFHIQTRWLVRWSLWWYCLSRAASSEANGDESNESEEATEYRRLAREATTHIPDVRLLLLLLKAESHLGAKLRRVARDELDKLGYKHCLTLHGFGEGAREMPQVGLACVKSCHECSGS